MASINPKNFQVNTHFPMPANVSVGAIQVPVPSGTYAGGAGYANTLYRDITLSSDTNFVRVNITSSRRNMKYVGSPLLMYENDATFIAFVSARGNGVFRCYVMLTSGFDYVENTTSANNFTFNITGFKIP